MQIKYSKMQTPWVLVIVFDTSSSLWLAHRTTTGQARVAHRLVVQHIFCTASI